MSNKVYILFSGILVSLTMIGLFVVASKMQESKAPPKVQPAPPAVSRSVAASPQAAAIPVQDRALTILNMWYELEPDETSADIRVNSHAGQAQKVGVHTDLLTSIKPGYKVQLPRLIGSHYFLKLDKIEKISDSEIQIYGELEDQGESYFSTISIIDNTLLAVLSTPKGDYDIKMVDGRGVVYKSDDDGYSKAVIDQPGFLDR